MSHNKSEDTYRRLLRKLVGEINALRPDSNEKLKKRLNKKFAKYMEKVKAFEK